MSIILTLIMGVFIGFVIATLMMVNKISEFEEEISARGYRIYGLQSQVDNRDILINDLQEKIAKLKNELADHESN